MLRICGLTMILSILALPAVGNQNVVVVLDDSGSMFDTMRSNRNVRKIDAARNALRQVLSNLPDDAKVGVLALNSKGPNGTWVIPLAKVDRNLVTQNVSQIQARGGTQLGKFLKIGTDALLKLRSEQIYGDYRLLIITDGEAGDRHLVSKYLPDVVSRGITVDVIGVDMNAKHSLATQVHSYRRADDSEALTEAIAEVLAETGGVSDDSAEIDYEILDGIPDEIVVAALDALSQLENSPIGARGVHDLKDQEIARHQVNSANPNQPGSGVDRQQPARANRGTNQDNHAANPRRVDPGNLREEGRPSTTMLFVMFMAILLISKLFSKGSRSKRNRQS